MAWKDRDCETTAMSWCCLITLETLNAEHIRLVLHAEGTGEEPNQDIDQLLVGLDVVVMVKYNYIKQK